MSVRFAVIGFGFMGSVHIKTIRAAENAEIVAVVESDPLRLKSATTGNIGDDFEGDLLKDVRIYTTMEDMLAKENVDCVSICLPTPLHSEYTLKALQAGRHVVCEKPMALTLEECDAMIGSAEKYNRRLFMAQCIRFWPEYEALKQVVSSGELGAPVLFLFRRVCAPPPWAGPDSWFADPQKSGGCLFDLHVHDIDFVHYLLGRPVSVSSQGIQGQNGGNDAVMTLYGFEDNVMCFAEGSWIYPSGFNMSYTAVFEKGKLEFDFTATPALKLTRKGEEEPEPYPVAEGDGYQHEFSYFIDCLTTGKAPEKIQPGSARQSIEIALAEKKSIQTKKVVGLD